jgi:CRP-like cAMP-binding protein
MVRRLNFTVGVGDLVIHQLFPCSQIHKLNQGTLAEMVGTTRSRVSFFMNRFKDPGYIDYSSKSHIVRKPFHSQKERGKVPDSVHNMNRMNKS